MTTNVSSTAGYFARLAHGFAIAVAVVALLLSLSAHAQGRSVYGPGTIQGFAHDTEGNPAAGSLVVLTNRTEATERTATVDRNGGFFFFGVPSGSYTIKLDGGSGSMERDFVFIQRPGAGMTISLRLWNTGTSDPSEAGTFQVRQTNPMMMGQPALPAKN